MEAGWYFTEGRREGESKVEEELWCVGRERMMSDIAREKSGSMEGRMTDWAELKVDGG